MEFTRTVVLKMERRRPKVTLMLIFYWNFKYFLLPWFNNQRMKWYRLIPNKAPFLTPTEKGNEKENQSVTFAVNQNKLIF